MMYLLYYYCEEVINPKIDFPIALFEYDGKSLRVVNLNKKYLKRQCIRFELSYKFVVSYLKSIPKDFSVDCCEDLKEYISNYVNNFRFKILEG